MRRYLQNLYESSSRLNQQNILEAVQGLRVEKFLDVGCDEGSWTMQVAKTCHAREIYGIELIPEAAQQSEQKGIIVTNQDINQPWRSPDRTFDLIHANQVIEHVPDVDHFARELYRVLRPGGKAVVSTENGSSWHNIFAAILGWQIFSLTNVSELAVGLGNPMALHRGSGVPQRGWTHKVIFNYRGLVEFFRAHGFTNIKVRGAGYYPFPSWCGKCDVRHSHFLAIEMQRPN